MADLRAVAQQALEALESVLCDPEGKCCIDGSDADRAVVDKELAALRAALAQAEPVQGPVACSNTFGCRCPKHFAAQQAEPVQPAQESAGHTRFRVTVVDNAHPSGIPLEQWVQRKPLTGEELQKVLYSVATSIDAFSIVMTHWPLVARATEAAHGIKEAK